MPKLLLHICCATCAAYVIEYLRRDYEVTAYYYNPNIYPKEEYQKRMIEAKEYCQKNDIPFIEEPPGQDQWFLLTKGHEADPEKGLYRGRVEHLQSGQTMRFQSEKLSG